MSSTSFEQRVLEALGELAEKAETLEREMGQVSYAIFGNGEPGIKTRLDRVEQNEARRMKWVSGIVLALVPAIAGWVWWAIKH